MQAIWLENQNLEVRSGHPVPEPRTGEALIRLLLAGICSTDLEMVNGYYPFQGILGHEFAGEVIACPSDVTWVGARVVGEINIVCGSCAHCRAGRSAHCLQRSALGIKGKDGAFSEFFTLPMENLHRVPDSVSDQAAVFTEPLAAALQIQSQVQIHPEDRVLVVGAGRLGQLIAQSLVHTGCYLRVLIRREKQRRNLTASGIKCVDQTEIKAGGADIVIDASGSPEGFEIARRAVRARGTIIVKSTYAGNLNINMSSIVVDEVSLIGSRCGPFHPALQFLETKFVNPESLIEATYKLEDGLAAFEHAVRPGVMKILLSP